MCKYGVSQEQVCSEIRNVPYQKERLAGSTFVHFVCQFYGLYTKSARY